MSAILYFGEAAGGRVLRYGTGITNVGTDYQFDLTTWDIIPATEVGDNVFRSIDVAFRCTNGYSIGITPIVDGVNLTEQTFSGAGTGNQQCQAFFATRGARCAARVRTLSRAGEYLDFTVNCAFTTIRATP